jgi:dCMP deaminase
MDAKWTARFINLAAHVAGWSKDPSSQVGAVIVRPDRSIASVGFNGFPRGVEDSRERISDRDTKLLYTIHAEMNAILAAKEPLTGHSIFVYPYQPCAHCAAAIVQAGIKEVYCPADTVPRWEESFEAARTMFHEAGTVVRWL